MNQENEMPLAESVKLGLEVIRALSQTAEACLLFVQNEGHDPEMVDLALHASDRAEHVAQYFLEAPDKIWPLDSVLDDLAWLTEVSRIVDRARVKVHRDIPTGADLEALSDRVKANIAADAEANPHASGNGAKHFDFHKFGKRYVTITQSLENLKPKVDQPDVAQTGDIKQSEDSPLSGWLADQSKVKTFPLNLDGKESGHMMIIGGYSSGPRPDSYYQSLAGIAVELDGRDFASLTALDLFRFRALRTEGRKFGLFVRVDVVNDSEEIQAELAAASTSQQEDIYMRLSTKIVVFQGVLDSGGRSQ